MDNIFFSTREPVYREEEETFLAWWAKTPLGRRRQKALETEIEAKVEAEAANGKGKGKKVKA